MAKPAPYSLAEWIETRYGHEFEDITKDEVIRVLEKHHTDEEIQQMKGFINSSKGQTKLEQNLFDVIRPRIEEERRRVEQSIEESNTQEELESATRGVEETPRLRAEVAKQEKRIEQINIRQERGRNITLETYKRGSAKSVGSFARLYDLDESEAEQIIERLQKQEEQQ